MATLTKSLSVAGSQLIGLQMMDTSSTFNIFDFFEVFLQGPSGCLHVIVGKEDQGAEQGRIELIEIQLRPRYERRDQTRQSETIAVDVVPTAGNRNDRDCRCRIRCKKEAFVYPSLARPFMNRILIAATDALDSTPRRR